ncbi:hypothetical protein EPO15_09490 [bacterium]|nr:MAG: hypothetical protein EPO15_09490 [bacterium]
MEVSGRLQELRRGAALAALALLAACDASLTVTRRRVKGPVAEVGILDPGAARVRWALKGPGWLVAKRKARAMKLAAEFCGGPGLVKGVLEKDLELAETRFTEDDLDAETFADRGHYKVDMYRMLEFECEKPQP